MDAAPEPNHAMPRIVHADDTLLAVDKPAGQLAVPGRGVAKRDCAWLRVRCTFADALVVHRLDQATSGLLLFARGAAAQRALSRAFAMQQVHKRYEAIVEGLVADDQGCIELPLAADWPNRPRQRVDGAAGKPACTRWRVLQRDPAAQRTRLELEPLTGRTHQLRVHLAAIGHAIVGDALYAPPPAGAAPARLLLHASALQLTHPSGGRPLSLCSPTPF